MSTSKEELEKISLSYHSADSMKDKFIEDESQFYTYDWVFKNLHGCNSVLEMGYGEGHFTEQLVKRGFETTLVDGAHTLIERAQKAHGKKLACVHELFENYQPSRKFDAILATHVLEHVDQPVALLNKMKTWLTHSGKIIVIVPNAESIHRQLAVIMKLQNSLDTLSQRDKVVGHQRVYSIESLSRDVEKAGLNILGTTGFFLKVLPNSMMLEYSNELVKALNQISPLIPSNLLANIGLVAESISSD